MVTIIDYEAGNLASVARALVKIGQHIEITGNPENIVRSQRIVFPGVGAAGSAMASLRKSGMDAAIVEAVRAGIPTLGICLGTQVIMDRSSENDAQCLGIIKGRVLPFPGSMTGDDGARLKIPHMGWNRISILKSHPVFSGIEEDDQFYFVHSYYPEPEDSSSVIAVTEHGISFASVIGDNNLVATQFHPEKSGRAGLRILENFCRWTV